MKKLPFVLSLIMLLSAIFSVSSVQAQDRKGWSPQAKGAVIGGLGGAAAGAIINKRNRPVGGVVGGVAGGAIGYGVGKHIDNKQKERARIAAANRAAANREAEYRRSIARSNARQTTTTTRIQTTAMPANSLVASSAEYNVQAMPAASNAAYLPNDSYGDPSHPYSTSEYRRKSW
ncbi:hypothetical protein BEN47_03265 [Hymenobacter lapidarius]|uniref:YMGG-like Gly-zipper domain-containing protein n=1 Tax=Hymenobacter lapidarius TaxID=1908237 RepID=A0A1G1T0L1_9BACT|nr:YMGG-like glycine zipper-containing protein [Hymenobacter lapidarius]OGX84410.1 hypothetical protein BEN47_03265 [Hymenobacter lapidarius]